MWIGFLSSCSDRRFKLGIGTNKPQYVYMDMMVIFLTCASANDCVNYSSICNSSNYTKVEITCQFFGCVN